MAGAAGLLLSVLAIGCGDAGRPPATGAAHTSGGRLASCVARLGVTLPPGATSPSSIFRNGGVLGPKGTTPAELKAALRRCGFQHLPVAGVSGEAVKIRGAIRRFSRCLQEHGATVSPPDFSGRVPVMEVSVPAQLPQKRLEQACAEYVLHEPSASPREGQESTITLGSA